MTKAVDKPEMKQIERRLMSILKKERRDAIGFTVLTVLLTPFLVALAGLVALGLVWFIADQADYQISIQGLYTCINLFLAGLAGYVARYSDPSESGFDFDLTWLAGGVVFIVLLYLTYGTSLMEKNPLLFGIVYTCTAFLVTGFYGRVFMKVPVAVDYSDENPFKQFGLLVFGYIAMSYGEVATSSWLWFPPDDDDISVAALILFKLSADEDGCIEVRSADRRILNLLSCLKLIRIRNIELQLTLKGQDFIEAANVDQYAVE